MSAPYKPNEDEWGVVGALLASPQDISTISQKLKPEEMIDERARVVYKIIIDLHDQGLETDSVKVAMEARKHNIKASEIIDNTGACIPGLIDSYFRQIKDARERDRILRLGKKAVTDVTLAGVPASQAREDLLDAITSFTYEEMETQAEFGDNALDEILEHDEKGYLSTGFKKLDNVIRLERKQFVVFAGGPGTGKTSMMLNIAETIAHKSQPTLIIELEMHMTEIKRRMVSNISGVPYNDIAKQWKQARNDDSGKLLQKGKQMKRRLEKAAYLLSQMPIVLCDRSSMNLQDLRVEVRKAKQKHDDLCFVFIDYFGLMHGQNNGFGGRNYELGAISRGCKKLAKEFDVCVVALSQISRTAEKEKRRIPVLSDLRDTGELEQDASVVAAIHYPVKEDEKYVRILKNRNGPTGVDVGFKFDKETMTWR